MPKGHKAKFSYHSKKQSKTKPISTVKNYSMLKKYLVTNEQIGDKKYTVSHMKSVNKNYTPVSTSIHVGENSIDSKTINMSQLSNRSHLDNTQSFQTPRTGVSRKFKMVDSKKSDLTAR